MLDHQGGRFHWSSYPHCSRIQQEGWTMQGHSPDRHIRGWLSVAGPKPVVQAFLSYLRRLWNTSEPVFLSSDVDFPFLGINVQKLPHGLFLHQATYTDALLEERGSFIPSRTRWTTGEPEHFKKEDPLPPDNTWSGSNEDNAFSAPCYGYPLEPGQT